MPEETVSQRDYFDSQIKATREFFVIQVASLKEATSLAAANMDKRLEGMNEFRAQLKDQTNTFLTKAEYEANYKILLDRTQNLELTRAQLSGKADQSAVNRFFLFSVIGVFLGIAGFVFGLINLISK